LNATLREIVLAVRYGDASLVGESVGYLILGVCDRAVAVPRVADLDGVMVTGEGDVVLDATIVTELEAEQSLRQLLGQLLTLLRTPFPNLARVATREPCGLGHLVTELEAALVPVNRRAAKRSLSRLVRETRRSLAREHLHAATIEVDARPVVQAEVAAPAWSPATLPEISWARPTLPEIAVAPELVASHFQPSQPPPTLPEPWPSQPLLTEPAPPEDSPSDGHDAWEIVDEVPSLFAEPVTQIPVPASGVWPTGQAQADDEFDQALTRVTTAVETLPAPAPERRSSFNMQRLQPAPALEGPLLPGSESASVTPSSIEELLRAMRIEGEPADVVLAGLARLARVDLSPPAPPVG